MSRIENDAFESLKDRHYPTELLPQLAGRIRESLPCFASTVPRYLRWLFDSREHTNYTYELSKLNKRHMACLCRAVTGCPLSQCMEFVRELDEDSSLLEHIIEARRAKGNPACDYHAGYARRTLWYVLTRITKPSVVLETGLDQGLGSIVLSAALLRNQADGHPGKYIGVDIDPSAGWLLNGKYREVGEIRIGDSLKVLSEIGESIDLAVLDSSHTPDYETNELRILDAKLKQSAIVISDTGDYNDELLNFAEATGRDFLVFREALIDHWYPGNGNGIAFKSRF